MPSSSPSRISQFTECVSKEFLASILSFRYPLTLILVVVSALFVTAVRTQVYRKQVADYCQAERDWRQTMGSVRWSWQSVGIGLSFEKRPEALAIFAFGLENEMTRSVKFSEYYPDRVGLRKLNATSFRYFSQIDVVTVIYFGCSLLALLLVFDTVTAAKERGTMRILLAGPLKRTTVILAKIAAGLLTLSVPVVLAWGFSIAHALMVSGHTFSSEDCLRILGMVLASLLYIGTVFAIGLGISCWARSSNASLILSLLVWLLLVLFLPSAAKGISDKVHPVPSFASVEQDREALQAATHSSAVIDSLATEILKKEPALVNDRDALWQRINTVLEKRTTEFQENQENMIGNNLALFGQTLHTSPAWSFVSIATTLAGTGAQDYLRLVRLVRMFRSEFQRASVVQKAECDKRAARPYEGWVYDAPTNPFVPELWPAFRFTKASLCETIPVALVDVVWLAGFMVLFLIAAIAGFIRSEL